MGVVVAIIVLTLVFGGVGLFVAAAKGALIIAAVLLVVGLVMAFTSSSRSRT